MDGITVAAVKSAAAVVSSTPAWKAAPEDSIRIEPSSLSSLSSLKADVGSLRGRSERAASGGSTSPESSSRASSEADLDPNDPKKGAGTKFGSSI